MKTYTYYFENKTCRTIKNVIAYKVDTWIHLKVDNGEVLINPDKVNLVRVQ